MERSATNILAVTESMASVQAAAPDQEDFIGFNNADFPLGLVLSLTGDVERCAALLWLYPRQVEGHGITRDDLLPHLPDSFDGSRSAARALLNDSRELLQGHLGFVATDSGVVFNGVRLAVDTTKALKSLGAVRTSTGYLLANSKLAVAKRLLGASIINADSLDALIEANPQEAEAQVVTQSLVTLSVEGNTVYWTYLPRNPLFGQVKEIVKGIGAKYNGVSGWDMKPANISVLALTLMDLNLEGVNADALAPFISEDPSILALKEEIATDSIRVKVTPVGDTHLKLNIRKYHQSLIDSCKEASGRYDGEGGWTVHKESIPSIFACLSQVSQFDLSELDAFLPSEEDLKKATIAPLQIPTHTPTGFPLFPHQIDDVAFLIRRATDAKGYSKLLANDMGTGKTLVSIVAANFMFSDGRFLVVVPAVAKLNWAKEIRKWVGAGEAIQVVSGRTSKLDKDARWIIINYDIISFYKDAIAELKFDIAILDEIHNIKNISAQRSKALIPTFNIKAQVMEPGILSNIPTVWAMTGTFIMNRMKELFTTLRAVEHRLGRSKRKFEERYCEGHDAYVGKGRTVWMANGATNLGELATKVAPVYRKVLKVDVIKDLPLKLRDDFQVEVSKADLMEIRHLEMALQEALESYRDEEEGPTILPFITKMKMATAKMKVQATIEQAEAVLETGNKVIIFTEYTGVLKSFTEHFGTKAVYIDGSITGAKREEAVERFQTDPEILVLVGNIKACGVAITLTAANHVIFNDKPWNFAMAAQAEDRAFRIGQTKNVTIIYMTAPGTYDEQLSQKLLEKSTLVTNWETMTDAEVKALSPKSETAEIMEYIRRKRVAEAVS